MKIDGKDNVKERIKIFENSKYTTYLYIFENGSSYKETVSKWKQTDFINTIIKTPEDIIDSQLDKLVHRR